MTKKEIVEKFCDLSCRIGEHINYRKSVDCFCHTDSDNMTNIQFEIFDIFEEAISDWMIKHPKQYEDK